MQQDSPLPAVFMIVGMVLMAAGYFSESAIPTSAVWTDEQAKVHGENASRLHSASYGAGHDHSQPHSHEADPHKRPEYLAAKEAFEKSKAELDAAYSRQTWIKYGFIFAGVLVTGIGIVQVAMTKMREDEQPRNRKGR